MHLHRHPHSLVVITRDVLIKLKLDDRHVNNNNNNNRHPCRYNEATQAMSRRNKATRGEILVHITETAGLEDISFCFYFVKHACCCLNF